MLLVNITNMQRHIIPCCLEQLRHLLLRQPDGVVLQTDLEAHGLVGLVEDDLSLLRSAGLRGLYVVRHIVLFYIFNPFHP